MSSRSRPLADEVVRRGQAIYDERIRPHVEASDKGKFVVIDIETGAYEIDDDEMAAFDRAAAKNPSGIHCLLKIGSPAAHRIGGRFRIGQS